MNQNYDSSLLTLYFGKRLQYDRSGFLIVAPNAFSGFLHDSQEPLIRPVKSIQEACRSVVLVESKVMEVVLEVRRHPGNVVA